MNEPHASREALDIEASPTLRKAVRQFQAVLDECPIRVFDLVGREPASSE